MYMPTLARFTSRDPLPTNGSPLVGGRSRARRNRRRRPVGDGYRYVRNNPINTVDPSGLQDEEAQSVACELRVCLNPIGGSYGALGGHLYLVLKRTVGGLPVEWGYRGGPGLEEEKRGEGCDCTGTKYGQLIGTDDEYKEGFVDYVPPDDENCKDVTVDAPSCEDVHECLVDVLHRIDKCCITYTPVPAPLGLGKKCNSNCVVNWMLKLCLAPKGLIGFIPLPIGKIAPGVYVPPPRCVRQPEGENAEGSAMCPVCPGADSTTT